MSKATYHVKKLVLIAILGASLNAAKFCLMYLPNIEVVTILIAAYTFCFGLSVGLPAALVFCTIEGLIFGFNPTWIISYYIHWPFIALVAGGCKLLKIKNTVFITFIFGLATALFGFQSTFIYFLVGGALKDPLWLQRYYYTYASGAVFYIAQIACNLILFLFAFKPICKTLSRLGNRYFGKSALL